ncbi:hypothetical protein H4R20_004762 [Coemansia guatemalensis]|uniref:Mis12-domain-containing protein n=1 Tax=Coemansia guatemalensis TaxID=2761395 RepID=A0A9W8HU09_9FUNG|nr:hypothetical protein H4R20_004762 [Coemansia guatemalensis]
MVEDTHPATPAEKFSTEPANSTQSVEIADTAATVPMVVDEEQSAQTNVATTKAAETPRKSIQTEGDILNDLFVGATPGKHAEPQFKCVYPPSEDAQSLIVEHFGFLPISFIDEIINAANDTIYRATDALCKFVEKEQGSGEATSQAVNKAETLLEHAVDKNFDKFELYALRNLFNIPQGLEDYVVLPHRTADATGGHAVDAEDEAELDKELEEVRRQLIANNLLKTRLQFDISKVERGVRRLRALNEHLHISEISQKVLKDTAPATIANVRAQVGEITRLVEQMDVASASKDMSSIDMLNEPSGRDLYLAHMSNIQVSDWEGRQTQQETN